MEAVRGLVKTNRLKTAMKELAQSTVTGDDGLHSPTALSPAEEDACFDHVNATLHLHSSVVKIVSCWVTEAYVEKVNKTQESATRSHAHLMATGEIGRHTVFARPHVEEESVIVSDCVTDHQLRTTVNRVSCRTVADEDIGSKVNEIKVVTQNHVQWTATGANGRISDNARNHVTEVNNSDHVCVTILRRNMAEGHARCPVILDDVRRKKMRLESATQNHVLTMATGEIGLHTELARSPVEEDNSSEQGCATTLHLTTRDSRVLSPTQPKYELHMKVKDASVTTKTVQSTATGETGASLDLVTPPVEEATDSDHDSATTLLRLTVDSTALDLTEAVKELRRRATRSDAIHINVL